MVVIVQRAQQKEVLSQLSLPLHMLFEADEALVADDDVIDQLDLQEAASGHELPGCLDVVGRGGRIPAGVVVAEDQAWAVADDGGPEDLGHAHHRAVDGALVAADLLDELALAVQQQDEHLLAIQVGHVQHHQVRRVQGRADLHAGVLLQQAEPPPDL